jgi:hypothetical protein
MSQRGSGQAPPPADNGLGRRYGFGRSGDRARADQPADFGSGDRAAPSNGELDDDLDPRQLDRYLEDRARLASPSSATSLSSDRAASDDLVDAPLSRWSSPARRRRREAEQLRPEEPVESASPARRRASEPAPDPYLEDVEQTDWAGEPIDEDFDHWGTAENAPPSTRRYAPGRARRRVARPRAAVTLPAVRVPSSISQSDLLHDPIALALLGGGAVLAFVMALVTATRVGDLPSVLVLREDAYGMATRWGPPKSLWQLPLLVTMVTLINLVLAAAVSRFDRFASRFLLAAALVVAVVAWVPVAHFLF